mgnify:FL=1
MANLRVGTGITFDGATGNFNAMGIGTVRGAFNATGTITGDGSGITGITSTALPSGSILQVLQTVKTDTASTGGNSYTTIADLTSTITTTGSNKVLVKANLKFGVNGGNAALFRLSRTTSGSTTNQLLIGDDANNRARISAGGLAANADWEINEGNCEFIDSPGAGTHAYFVQWAVPSGNATAYLNRSYRDQDQSHAGRLASTITTMEIAV